MTPRPTGPHRDQVPSPDSGAPSSIDRGDPAGPHSARPLLRVVSGSPSDEELAALVAVVATLSQRGSRRSRPTPLGGWASRADALRRPVQVGPGGWRASGRSA